MGSNSLLPSGAIVLIEDALVVAVESGCAFSGADCGTRVEGQTRFKALRAASAQCMSAGRSSAIATDDRSDNGQAKLPVGYRLCMTV